MTAVAWRLFRAQAGWGLGALVVVGIVLLVTGPHLVHVYDAGVSACRSAGGVGPACSNPVLDTDHAVQVALSAVVLLAPALVGIFWGAPLVARELETGTFRLAWTQSVTRRRWLATKLAVGGLASLLGGVALSLMATWWFAPIDDVTQNRFTPGVFQIHGLVPGGYALFAFALGATTGLLFRRVLPAMATTLVLFVGVRLVTTFGVRPHLLPPVSRVQALSPATFGLSITPSGPTVVPSPPDIPNAWVVSTSIVDKAGHSPTVGIVKQLCPGLPGVNGVGPPKLGLGGVGSKAVQAVPDQVQSALASCVANMSHLYHVVVTYQPANRFWSFQVLETAEFVVLSLLLGALCAWWLKRRLS